MSEGGEDLTFTASPRLLTSGLTFNSDPKAQGGTGTVKRGREAASTGKGPGENSLRKCTPL